MFQLVFANSLFGQTYERVNIAPRHRAEFAEARRASRPCSPRSATAKRISHPP